MFVEVIILCLTIAGTVGGAAYVLGDKIGHLETRVEALDNRVGALDSHLTGRIESVENRLSNIEDYLRK